ncbi:MAG: PLDc N-terminal domain-containing protein [Propioniciclava sp.]
MPRVLLILLIITVMITALVEAFQATETAIRLMPRWLWVTAIICLPGLGALCWFAFGRPRRLPGPETSRPRAPDDDPDFLRGL